MDLNKMQNIYFNLILELRFQRYHAVQRAAWLLGCGAAREEGR